MIYLTTYTLTFYLAIGLGVILIFLLLWVILKNTKNVNQKHPVLDYSLLLSSLGGYDNISEPQREHQRIKMKVLDVKKINANSLKDLGIPAFLKGKELTILIKHHTKDVLSYLSERQKEGL